MLDRPIEVQRLHAGAREPCATLGEITLATLVLDERPGAPLRLTLSGPQRQRAVPGVRLGVRLDLALVHVMPLRKG